MNIIEGIGVFASLTSILVCGIIGIIKIQKYGYFHYYNEITKTEKLNDISKLLKYISINNIYLIDGATHSPLFYSVSKLYYINEVWANLYNKNNWMVVIEPMNIAYIMPENTLRKFNYFDACIRNSSKMNKNPNIITYKTGINICKYNIKTTDNNIIDKLIYSTPESIAKTFNIIHSIYLTNINNYIDNIDMSFVNTVSGIIGTEQVPEDN